jgi:hypothetical protein
MATGVNRHVVSMHHVVTDVHPDRAHRYVGVSVCDTFHLQVIWGRSEKEVWRFHSCGPED